MNLLWLDRLGDWNPQLFRELKGRLKSRNLAVVTAGSLLIQFLGVMNFYFQSYERGYTYCVKNKQSECLVNATGQIVIDWPHWWLELFTILSWILPFILLLGTVYTIVSDVGKEQHRGTLNFIKLSPESSENILIGKILGAPILLYAGILLFIPLHLVSAIGAGVPLGLLLSFYLLVWGCCLFFGNIMLLYSFQVGFHAWWCSFLTLIFGSPCLQIINFLLSTGTKEDVYDSNLQWFYLPIGSNLLVLEVFLVLTCGLCNYVVWQSLNRRFRQPNATLISKKQSYWLVAGFEVLILGFFVGNYKSDFLSYHSYWDWFGLIAFLEIINLFAFVFLIPALLPHRQELQDWVRYRRLDGVSNRKALWNRYLVQDLVWGEKSPAVVAIALNLVIKTVVWTAWAIFFTRNPYKIETIAVLILSYNLILIYAAIAQMMLLMKTPKRGLLAATAVSGLILLPLLAVQKSPGLLLFSAFPWFAIEHASATAIFMSLLGQWSLLGLLSVQMTKKLRQAGESASKALFSERPSLPTQ
ncbi:hypothetical protein [Argonema antarcticum]|uniref:hypothetical protein n=1 Tax=Argonema antarcticum TaxID=2942763 RepID=UPI0020136B83|nr:hypothetical protein [Argonema antarcticum]MCL1472082.1 hypothetical protein [Argonema antarcticum A004/B2]